MKYRKLADERDPLVQQTAQNLTQQCSNDRQRLQRLFYYVRDEIKFGFPQQGDLVSAAETIQSGMGQCNTKATLFLALCRAVGIQARIHFSTIRKEIQQGLFEGFMFRLMPDEISHSWVEVSIEDSWRRLDSFINDEPFYLSGKQALADRGWDTGFSISCAKQASSIEFNIDEEAFVQMDAVVDDHGVWDDPMDYYQSDKYKNRPGVFKLLIYRLNIGSINRKIQAMRRNCSKGLCGTPARNAQSAG